MLLANGTTFTFSGTAYTVTAIRVSSPQPEIVNMTAIDSPLGQMWMVKTGDALSPGTVEIDVLGVVDPTTLVGTYGDLEITGTAQVGSGLKALCESATMEARVADVIRGSVRFVLTDIADN